MSAHRDRGLERMRDPIQVECFFINGLNFISLMVLAFKKIIFSFTNQT